RAVLIHLSEPKRALQRMAAGLKSGGWLLAEEGDSTSLAPQGDRNTQDGRLFIQLRDAIFATYAAAGVDWHYGRRLYDDVPHQDLVNVAVEGRLQLVHGGGALASYWRLTVERLRERLIRLGGLSEQQLEDAYRLFSEPAFSFTTQTIWAVRGKRLA